MTKVIVNNGKVAIQETTLGVGPAEALFMYLVAKKGFTSKSTYPLNITFEYDDIMKVIDDYMPDVDQATQEEFFEQMVEMKWVKELGAEHTKYKVTPEFSKLILDTDEWDKVSDRSWVKLASMVNKKW